MATEITVGFVGPMASEYVPNGIPFLRSLNVKPFRINRADLMYVSESFHQRIKKSTLAPGDVVIVRTGKPGTAAVIPDTLPIANCSDLVIVRPGPQLDSKFLAYYINSAAQHHVYAHTVGAVQQHFNVGSAKTLKLLKPPLDEQRAIVRILGALDDKIDLNRRMNRTMEAMAQTLFRSWFMDFEPVIAKREGRKPVGMDDATASLFPEHFQETGIGPIPAGWRQGSTADIARYVNGKNFTKDATGSGRMVIRIAELNSGPAGSTIYNDIKSNPENTAFPGDLLFAWSGSLDVYRWHRDQALVNQHIFKVLCKEYPQWFVHFHLQEAMPFFQGVAADKATTMGHIKREHLSQPDVALPPAELIAAASRIIQPMYDRMHRSERQIFSLAAQRDTLLPQLLSGELRVGMAEKMIEEA